MQNMRSRLCFTTQSFPHPCIRPHLIVKSDKSKHMHCFVWMYVCVWHMFSRDF